MKDFARKAFAVFATLTMMVSLACTTCHAAFTYDDETILPLWVDEDERNTGDRS